MLRYTLEQGPNEQSIIKQCIERKLPLPERIANAPTLHFGLELYYAAFFDLSTCRSIGQGEGPIPWSATFQWAEVHGLTTDQYEDLKFFIAEMDSVYLEHQSNELKKKGKKVGGKS